MLETAMEAARAAGRLQLEASTKPIQVDRLEQHDIKLAVDRASEEAIVSIIADRFPEHGILSEECGRIGNSDSRYTWVVDPLDGTYNFSRAIPVWCTSIGLVERGEEVLGVIYDASRDEMFTAVRGEGAFLNGRPMHATQVDDLGFATVAFAYGPDVRFAVRSTRAVNRMAATVAKMRALGSASLHMAYVACGRVDAFFEFGIYQWDIAAGLAMIREAGGAVATRSHDDGKVDVAVSNGLLQEGLLEMIAWDEPSQGDKR